MVGKKFLILCIVIGGCYGLWDYYQKEQQKKKAQMGFILNTQMSQPSAASSDYYPQQQQSMPQQPVSQQQMVETVCPFCHGAGVYEYMPGDAFAPVVTCPNCQGKKVVSVPVEEVMRNASTGPANIETEPQNQQPLQCPNCYGSGKCSGCAGRGEHNYSDLYGQHRYDCSICKGTGRCQGCHGSGHI